VIYKHLIAYLRNVWKSCLTDTGRRQRGPTWYAITRCDDDGNIGLTSIKTTPAGKRWACKTCVGFAPPIWTDNEKKCPSEDEALHEYAGWVSPLSVKSPARMQRRRIKRIYMQDGTSRGKYARSK
jgi:hypothetical protein